MSEEAKEFDLDTYHEQSKTVLASLMLTDFDSGGKLYITSDLVDNGDGSYTILCQDGTDQDRAIQHTIRTEEVFRQTDAEKAQPKKEEPEITTPGLVDGSGNAL